MFRAPNTCYTCGQADHFDKECPHNNFYDQESNNQIVPKNDKDLNPNAAAFQPPSMYPKSWNPAKFMEIPNKFPTKISPFILEK